MNGSTFNSYTGISGTNWDQWDKLGHWVLYKEPGNPLRTPASSTKALSWPYPKDSCCDYSIRVTTWKHLKFRECLTGSQKTLFGEPRKVKWDKENRKVSPRRWHVFSPWFMWGITPLTSTPIALALENFLPVYFSSIWQCLNSSVGLKRYWAVSPKTLWSILVLLSMALKGFYFHFFKINHL